MLFLLHIFADTKINKMNTEDSQFVIGQTYPKDFLEKSKMELVNKSCLFMFYRNEKHVYVFDLNNKKHPDEFLLVAIWDN